MISEAIDQLGIGWSLCFIGENQSDKLALLTDALKEPYSKDGNGKQIASGFSYWGVGPTLAWLNACKDQYYPVMNKSIANFAGLWRKTVEGIEEQKFEYVSLGVGTGEKDQKVLSSLVRHNPGMHYFPVDMSPEMLRVGAREAIQGTGVSRHRILPIQIDFSFDENVAELRSLLDVIIEGRTALISLLGNTLSNFEDDAGLLGTIRSLLRPEDRLLLEVAFTDSIEKEAQNAAADEYDNSRMFKEFVSSSLLRNTDIRIDNSSLSFLSCAEKDRAILIKAIYGNRTGQTLEVMLPNREMIDFLPDDTIRLLTMRKYTRKGIDQMLEDCGFQCLKREPVNFPSRRSFRFGTELLLLQPCKPGKGSTRVRYDIFLAHAGGDTPRAQELSDLIGDRCKVFLDKQNLELGSDWDAELPKAQRLSMITVVLISPRTGGAYYENEEIARAIRLARKAPEDHRVVPVFLEGWSRDDEPPYGLERKHAAFIGADYTLQRLADDLVRLVQKNN